MTLPAAISLSRLSKTFGRRRQIVQAVQDLSLEVLPGQVFGFLGPNGAGKTTTIRLLLDLLRPSGGSAHIFGRNVRSDHDVLSQVGAIVEGASFYPFLSGRQNLQVLFRTGGGLDQARIDNLLEKVGLLHRADQRVGGYSTGMKQRLGLAAALVHDPTLVILDEPTNGLDPAGIQEMRTFIRSLVDEQGKTVFLSSHILSEVEQVCDRVAIIHEGRLIREGGVAELLSGTMELRIEASPLAQAADILRERWPVETNGQHLRVQAPHYSIPEILRPLIHNEIDVYQVISQRQTLEQYFLAVTQQPSSEAEAHRD